MISFDFDYFKAETAEEAINKYLELDNNNKIVYYYNGGTEIVTYARKDKINFDALIDIKDIPACNEHKINDNKIIFGASLSLNEIVEKNFFPLLSKSSKVIADHTTRNQITIGGNITGRLPFKEVLLPLLVSDAKITTIDKEGFKTRPINKVFNKRLELKKGEILLQIIVEKEKTSLPFYHTRKVKQSEIDYPILHIAALKDKDKIKIGISSLCAFPFRNETIENILNNIEYNQSEKINKVLDNLPVPINSNQRAGREYKKMLFINSLEECLNKLGGAK